MTLFNSWKAQRRTPSSPGPSTSGPRLAHPPSSWRPRSLRPTRAHLHTRLGETGVHRIGRHTDLRGDRTERRTRLVEADGLRQLVAVELAVRATLCTGPPDVGVDRGLVDPELRRQLVAGHAGTVRGEQGIHRGLGKLTGPARWLGCSCWRTNAQVTELLDQFLQMWKVVRVSGEDPHHGVPDRPPLRRWPVPRPGSGRTGVRVGW